MSARLKALRDRAASGGTFSTDFIHGLLVETVIVMCEHGVQGRAPAMRQFRSEFVAGVLGLIRDMLSNTAELDRTLLVVRMRELDGNPLPDEQDDTPQYNGSTLEGALRTRLDLSTDLLHKHQKQLIGYLDQMVECQHGGMVS